MEITDNAQNEQVAKADEPVQDQLALVKGEAYTELPDDLYIPPEALQVFLEAFEGPLDLLLYLIKRQNMDILDIPIAEITKQYMDYVDIMKDLDLDLAAEYLVMAAMLAEIKSRMLLPRVAVEDEESEDPRAELIRKLQQYERYKKGAENLDEIPRLERDTFIASAEPPSFKAERPLPSVELPDLLFALKDILKRAELRTSHHIQLEPLSIRDRMAVILNQLANSTEFVAFQSFFKNEEGRQGVVVTFIAVLELLKGAMIDIVQAQAFGPIHVKAKIL
jgi:segregation and condensation protein A